MSWRFVLESSCTLTGNPLPQCLLYFGIPSPCSRLLMLPYGIITSTASSLPLSHFKLYSIPPNKNIFQPSLAPRRLVLALVDSNVASYRPSPVALQVTERARAGSRKREAPGPCGHSLCPAKVPAPATRCQPLSSASASSLHSRKVSAARLSRRAGVPTASRLFDLEFCQFQLCHLSARSFPRNNASKRVTEYQSIYFFC